MILLFGRFPEPFAAMTENSSSCRCRCESFRQGIRAILLCQRHGPAFMRVHRRLDRHTFYDRYVQQIWHARLCIWVSLGVLQRCRRRLLGWFTCFGKNMARRISNTFPRIPMVQRSGRRGIVILPTDGATPCNSRRSKALCRPAARPGRTS